MDNRDVTQFDGDESQKQAQPRGFDDDAALAIASARDILRLNFRKMGDVAGELARANLADSQRSLKVLLNARTLSDLRHQQKGLFFSALGRNLRTLRNMRELLALGVEEARQPLNEAAIRTISRFLRQNGL